MGFLAAFHWGWLVGAFLIGFVMGWIAVVYLGQAVPLVAKRWLSAFVAVLLILAFIHLIPGRFGYWLDLGLVMFACYLVGCAIGTWLRVLVISRQMPATPPGPEVS